MTRAIIPVSTMLAQANAALPGLYVAAGNLISGGAGYANSHAVGVIETIQNGWANSKQMLADYSAEEIDAAAAVLYGARAPASAHAALIAVQAAGGALMTALDAIAPDLPLYGGVTAAPPTTPEAIGARLAAMTIPRPQAAWVPRADVTAAAQSFRAAIAAVDTVVT